MAANKKLIPTGILRGQIFLRILIGAYIVGVGIGLIPGTGGTPLADTYLSPEPAALLGRSAFFILGYLVLTGLWLRPAAMLLAIILLWSSTIVHLGPDTANSTANLVRDLVLVAVLFLTFAWDASHNHRLEIPVKKTPVGRRLFRGPKVLPRRVTVNHSAPRPVAQHAFKHVSNSGNTENVFRDDLENMLTA